MLKSPPREKQWLSWLYVVSWILIIFVTIPLARRIQKFVADEWSRDLFTYFVVATALLGFAAAVMAVRRHLSATRSSYVWLTTITGFFVVYTIHLGQRNPEEAIHFVQYGVLGVLVYRAWTHRLQDTTVYFVAAITCGLIGALDEFIQWLTPRRVWGFDDIGLNLLSSALVQIAIAKGLRPQLISRRPSRTNLRFACLLAAAAIAIFGASLLLTPPRIAWVADRIGWLEFLKYNDGVILEYGYFYEDAEIGVFRSRFAPRELNQIDRERAAVVAEILNRFRDESSYPTFLKRYTPISDPFVHEARVHLFRRDRHFGHALESENYPVWYARHLTIAWRENRIMEKYFSHTLHHSDYVWPEEKSTLAHRHLLPGEEDDSWVSRKLITRIDEWMVVCLLLVLILSLMMSYLYFGKMPHSKLPSDL